MIRESVSPRTKFKSTKTKQSQFDTTKFSCHSPRDPLWPSGTHWPFHSNSLSQPETWKLWACFLLSWQSCLDMTHAQDQKEGLPYSWEDRTAMQQKCRWQHCTTVERCTGMEKALFTHLEGNMFCLGLKHSGQFGASWAGGTPLKDAGIERTSDLRNRRCGLYLGLWCFSDPGLTRNLLMDLPPPSKYWNYRCAPPSQFIKRKHRDQFQLSQVTAASVSTSPAPTELCFT